MFTKKSILFLLICFVFASCVKEDTQPSVDNLSSESLSEMLSESSTSAADRSASTSTVVIQEDADGPPDPYSVVPGASSKLKRKANGVKVNFKTNGLIPGNAYTLWWVILNDDGTGPPILVTYADGLVVNASGKGNFTSHLSVGEIFNTPQTAEIHLALRTHGPVQPDMMPEQIETIDGGCTSGFPTGPVLYPDSDVVGYCANIQVAMHSEN